MAGCDKRLITDSKMIGFKLILITQSKYFCLEMFISNGIMMYIMKLTVCGNKKGPQWSHAEMEGHMLCNSGYCLLAHCCFLQAEASG